MTIFGPPTGNWSGKGYLVVDGELVRKMARMEIAGAIWVALNRDCESFTQWRLRASRVRGTVDDVRRKVWHLAAEMRGMGDGAAAWPEVSRGGRIPSGPASDKT